MPRTLYRLAYCSRNAVPTGADFAAEMRRILDVSRRNNARIGVTGALLFNHDCFGQVLEGERAVLETLFETIETDERHCETVALQFEAVPERGFGPWSMAHVGTLTAPADGFGVISADINPANCSAGELFDTLQRILIAQEGLRSVA